jgi:hypothetical protein
MRVEEEAMGEPEIELDELQGQEEEVLQIGLEDYELAEDAEDEPEELTFEQQVDKIRRIIVQHSLNREILYRILKHCRKRRFLHDLEEHIATYPDFRSATQPQYFLIMWLVDAGGLRQLEVDENGNEVLEEQKEGLSEDEIDDLVVDYAYEITEAGEVVASDMDPKHRLLQLLEIVPDWYDTYVEVLEFLEEKRPFADVDSLLRGRDILRWGRSPDDSPMQPSVFIDKLEQAGGVVWNEGWTTTKEGKELLEAIKTRVED